MQGFSMSTQVRGFSDLDGQYEIIKQLGEGAYGVVVAAKDKSNGLKVAIKKIKDAVEDKEQGKLLLRELRLLRHFRGHENIVCIKDIIETPKGQSKFKDIFIITDLMDTDLHRIIRSSQGLSDDHVRYFTYQILRGLKYIHSADVMHRDLKPNNLLVNANCDLKICDLVNAPPPPCLPPPPSLAPPLRILRATADSCVAGPRTPLGRAGPVFHDGLCRHALVPRPGAIAGQEGLRQDN